MPLEFQEFLCSPFFEAVERRLTKQAFETWFRPLKVFRSGAAPVLRISAPNAVVKDWIISQYARALEESLVEARLDEYRIEWAILTDAADDHARRGSRSETSSSEA